MVNKWIKVNRIITCAALARESWTFFELFVSFFLKYTALNATGATVNKARKARRGDVYICKDWKGKQKIYKIKDYKTT